MLPDRSKRYAGIDGEIPRLELASGWRLLLIALLILALLVMIFPRKVLVEKLYEQETLDDLTVSYIQNLYRADPHNADIAILLAKFQPEILGIKTLESLILPLADSGDPRQRTEARMILANAYKKALAAGPDARERERLRSRLTDLMQEAGRDEIPERLARIFSTIAFELKMPGLVLDFLQRIEAGNTAKILEQHGQQALGQGEHGLAAEYFLLARNQTDDLDEARRLFKTGIGTLMAASRFRQAMESADQHLGNLENDPATLRYLARAALAAGDPAQAARYARKLVFQTESARGSP